MESVNKPQERNSIYWSCKNAKLGMLSSVDLSLYFEKHKILEIITAIIFELCIARPGNTAKWLSNNIRRIANEFQCSRTFLMLPNGFDLCKFSKYYLKQFHIPTIVYKGKFCGNTKDILNKLEKFLKKYNLSDKNKIFINFPENCQQLLEFQKHNIKPSNVFQVKCDTIKARPKCNLLENIIKNENYANIGCYYKDIYQIINYGSRKTAKNRLQTVKEVGMKLANLMEFSNIPNDRILKSNFRYRIIMYGYKGSGRQNCAMSIAKRFNLIPLDASKIITSYIEQTNGIGSSIRQRLKSNSKISLLSEAAAIQTRILETECLQHGWILFDWPYNKESFKICYEHQTAPPNRTIILHCSKKIALRRLQKSMKISDTKDYVQPEKFISFIENEMNYSDFHKNDIYNYLRKNSIPTIHIDANHSVKTILNVIYARLEQNQTILQSPGTPIECKFHTEII